MINGDRRANDTCVGARIARTRFLAVFGQRVVACLRIVRARVIAVLRGANKDAEILVEIAERNA